MQDQPIDDAVEWTVHLTHILEVSWWSLSPLAINHDRGFLLEADTRTVPKTGLTWPSISNCNATTDLAFLLCLFACLRISCNNATRDLSSVYVVLTCLVEMLPQALPVSHLSTQNEVPWMIRTLPSFPNVYLPLYSPLAQITTSTGYQLSLPTFIWTKFWGVHREDQQLRWCVVSQLDFFVWPHGVQLL